MQIRTHLESLPPYTPIEPFEVLSARIGREPSQIVKLDANENPYGVLPAVRKALAEMDFPHIYPDPESRILRKSLAQFTGVDEEYLLAGSGADELLDLLMRVFLEPNECILSCPPTFGMYPFDAELNAARCIEVPRKADFSLDMSAIRKAVDEFKPKLLFIASPNNPNGSLIEPSVMDELLSLPLLVVLDEAYIEFAGENLGASLSRIREVPQRENLIVLRTFSKWAGLAGLRIGYGAFPKWLMPTLWKSKQPYNVNVAASVAAQASLANVNELKALVEKLKDERTRLLSALMEISYLKPYPTQSNFILCQVNGRDAAELKAKLAQEFGVFIRHFNKPGLRDQIRISVGRPSDTDVLINALNVERST
ncbi:histidinol-phosphate aminotransferase [Anaerolineales bacterium]|nr:histidinol-phosphate aminotransferase [Anaerolineales bacterium]